MKKGIAILAAAATVLVTSLACGGGGGSYANVASCTAYVEHMNALTCYPGEMNVGQTCPAMLDQTACDMSDYYDCLVDNSNCEGDVPKFELSNCQMEC